MTGVAVMPIMGDTWLQLCVSLGTSPLPSSDTCHRIAPLSASKAYTESFSVATNTTLWLAPCTLTVAAYSGCASTLPSVASVRSRPKLLELTLASVSCVSVRFWPVREMSFL